MLSTFSHIVVDMTSIKRIAAIPYYFYNKYIRGNDCKANLALFWIHGHDKMLVDHQLSEHSVVFDVGGYKGIFSDAIISTFSPNIYIFEPVSEHYDILLSKYKDNPKVRLYNIGLYGTDKSARISVEGETSNVVFNVQDAKHRYEDITLMDVVRFMDETKVERIDLMSINTEGAEFDLLARLIESRYITKIRTLQVQFHTNIPDCQEKRREIIHMINRTHGTKFSYPFVWECFELREAK